MQCNNESLTVPLWQAIYCASKYFVEALSEGTRREVRVIVEALSYNRGMHACMLFCLSVCLSVCLMLKS